MIAAIVPLAHLHLDSYQKKLVVVTSCRCRTECVVASSTSRMYSGPTEGAFGHLRGRIVHLTVIEQNLPRASGRRMRRMRYLLQLPSSRL